MKAKPRVTLGSTVSISKKKKDLGVNDKVFVLFLLKRP